MTSIQATDSPNVRLITATEQCCKAEELPDETLDSIIRYVGAAFTVTPVSLPSAATGHASLHPCAMVCRRWYRITTPYLFRVVAIKDNSPGDASELCALLSRKPSLMQYIQAATIDRQPLPLNVLASLLDLLPHLHYLQILGVSDVCTGNRALLRGSHSLKKLTFGGLQSESESEDFDRDVLKLLQLFKEIDELVLYEDSRDPIQLDLNTAQLKTGEPRIHAIDVHDCIHDTAPYLTCLHEHGALRSLTCLTLDCDSPYKLEAINQWLLCAGATLGELYLSLDFSGNDQEIADPTNNESAVDLRSYVVVTLGSGIGACVALHGFRLEMCSSYQPWVDNRFPPDIITQIAVNDWLLCLTLLSLMASADSRPHGGHLRHVSFAYRSHSWEHEGEGYEVLPWEMMRSVLRRLHNLESVSIKFNHAHEKKTSLAVTEEAHTPPTFEEQTQKELASFKDILVCNDEELFLLCTQDSCRCQVPQHAHWKDLATEL